MVLLLSADVYNNFFDNANVILYYFQFGGFDEKLHIVLHLTNHFSDCPKLISDFFKQDCRVIISFHHRAIVELWVNKVLNFSLSLMILGREDWRPAASTTKSCSEQTPVRDFTLRTILLRKAVLKSGTPNQIKKASYADLFYLVRTRGLEPPRLATLVPETSASTNSATSAWV